MGAREIRIEEVAEAGNFLALRSEDPEKYFLNGGWTIQWNGDYRVAGTTFTYKRTGNWENLTSPGPTVEPVWIQVWILPSSWGCAAPPCICTSSGCVSSGSVPSPRHFQLSLIPFAAAFQKIFTEEREREEEKEPFPESYHGQGKSPQ